MSIFASIEGQDPRFHEDGYGGEELDPEGWMDVAVSVIGDIARVIVRDREGEGTIYLDPAGMAELHRRIVRARIEIDRRARWREQQQRP